MAAADAAWPLQEAIFAALSADSGFIALCPEARIYDMVPPDSGIVYPFTVLGDNLQADLSTFGKSGQDNTVTITFYSNYRGRKEVKQIMAAAYNVLHKADLAIAGFGACQCYFEYGDTALQEDGVTWQGVQRYRIRTLEA